MGPAILVRLGMVGARGAAMAACTVSSGTSDTGGWATVPTEDAGCPSCENGGGEAGGSPTLLATVDTNVTMTASPGQGVGIFTEYDTGGHWHIWWTCDTAVTGELCAVDVKVSVAAATGITNASADHFGAGDTLTTPSTPAAGAAGAIEARTTTTLNSEGVFFDTDPGATITLTGGIGGVYSGQFLFWVESGKVKDDYTGPVSDPLMLKGATP